MFILFENGYNIKGYETLEECVKNAKSDLEKWRSDYEYTVDDVDEDETACILNGYRSFTIDGVETTPKCRWF